MNIFRVNINLLMYFVVNFMIIMVILVFFMVISVNRRLFRYFGSYSGISVIPVILVSRRTGGIMIAPELSTKADPKFRLPKQTASVYWADSDK